MPIRTYKCNDNECGFQDEYIESFSVSKDQWHPDICPKCGKTKLEQVFDLAGNSIGIDFIGSGFYINDYGKHAWKRNLSQDDQAKVIAGNKDPY